MKSDIVGLRFLTMISDSKCDDTQIKLVANCILEKKFGEARTIIEIFSTDADATSRLISWKDEDGSSLLILSCKHGGFTLARLLISIGSDVDAGDFQDCSPLWYACESNSIDIVGLLLGRRCRVDNPSIEGVSPLILASASGNLSAVELLISAGADIEFRDSSGTTPLLASCESGNLEVAVALLGAGASPAVEDDFGVTPVVVACTHGHLPLVKLLFAHGVDPLAVNRSGTTLLYLASQAGHTSIVRLLLERGASLLINHAIPSRCRSTHELRPRYTALYAAVKAKNRDIVDLLLSRGARFDSCYSQGLLPLSEIVRFYSRLAFTSAMRTSLVSPRQFYESLRQIVDIRSSDVRLSENKLRFLEFSFDSIVSHMFLETISLAPVAEVDIREYRESLDFFKFEPDSFDPSIFTIFSSIPGFTGRSPLDAIRLLSCFFFKTFYGLATSVVRDITISLVLRGTMVRLLEDPRLIMPPRFIRSASNLTRRILIVKSFLARNFFRRRELETPILKVVSFCDLSAQEARNLCVAQRPPLISHPLDDSELGGGGAPTP